MVKPKEVKKKLKAAGWTFEEGGNHEKAVSPDGKIKIPIGRHQTQDIPTGTLAEIEKQSGIKMR